MSAVLVTACSTQRGVTSRVDPAVAPFSAHATAPAVGIVHTDQTDNPSGFVVLSISGSGLGLPASGTAGDCGAPAGGAFLEFTEGLTVPSTDKRIVLWKDVQIVAKLPAGAQPGRVRVCTPTGATDAVTVEYYAYDHFDIPLSAGTSAAPLALATDAMHRVWINEEFHLEFKSFDPETGSFAELDIPRPAGSGPFAATLFGDAPTQITSLGEAIMVDPKGRVWFTEGGAEPYEGVHADHSRVVAYDPNAAPDQQFRIYNVPGDRNGVVGVAWDERRRRVWLTEVARTDSAHPPAAVAQRARLVSFDPEQIPFDNDFDFATAATCTLPSSQEAMGTCSNAVWRACFSDADCILAEQVCPPGSADDSACYHEYEIPAEAGTYMPGHVVVHPDGTIWYTSYWGGNYIGRLDPQTGAFTILPLPEPVWKRQCDYNATNCLATPIAPANLYCCQVLLFGTGPWDIKVTPNRNVVFTEYFNSAVGRVWLPSWAGDPTCGSLDATGNNPCIDQLIVPGVDLPTQQVHSLASDNAGRTWFTQGTFPVNAPGANASLGYVDPNWTTVVLLPPLSLYPFANADGSYCPGNPGTFVSFSGAGIAIDPETQDIWFADFCRKRLGRLRRAS